MVLVGVSRQLTFLDIDMKTEDLTKLKAELTGPNKGRYDGKPHEDIALMFRDQVVNAGDADSLKSSDIVACIDIGDVLTIQPDDRYLLSLYAAAGTVMVTPQVKQFLKKAFPDNSKTDKQLAKLLRRAGTYAESIGLPLPTNNDIAEVLIRGKG